MKTEQNEIPRRSRMDKWNDAEKAIYNAVVEVEKMPADVKLTNAVIKLQAARDLVADFIDGTEPIKQPEKKQFLLQYKIGRRSDEGWGRLALVSAFNIEEAENILVKNKTYNYTDALASEIIKPDHITCLNID